MVVLWSCDLMVMWPVWGNGKIEGTTCRIGDNNSGYVAIHCGGNFNIGCNANTTIIHYRREANLRLLWTCSIKRISVSISGSCLPERANVLESLLSLYRADLMGGYISLWYNIQTKELSHQCQWRDNCSYNNGMTLCDFKSCPLDTPRIPIWYLISKPYLHTEIANRYINISRAQLPKSIYSNSCVRPQGPAGLDY